MVSPKDAKNKELGDLVVKTMCDFLFHMDTEFKRMVDENRVTGESIIAQYGNILSNKYLYLRFYFRKLIVHAYDFQINGANDVSANIKEEYEQEVKKAKESGGMFGFETFVKESIDNERYRWYVTKL